MSIKLAIYRWFRGRRTTSFNKDTHELKGQVHDICDTQRATTWKSASALRGKQKNFNIFSFPEYY